MAIAPILARAPNRKINWKLAAELRGQGLTYARISELTNGSGGDAIRQGLNRRGVNQGIRTTIDRIASNTVEHSLAKLSEETRGVLAKTVLNHSEALSKIKAKPNVSSIKALGQAMEPLARTAKIVHGWGESQKQSLISVNVLGQVQLADLTDTTIQSVPTQIEANPLPKALEPSEDRTI